MPRSSERCAARKQALFGTTHLHSIPACPSTRAYASTLAQLSKSVLSRLVSEGDVAWLFTDDGLAIGASAPALARELTEVNGKAGAAVLHYRTSANLPAGGSATPSATPRLNEVTERIIERSSAQPESAVSRVSIHGRRVVSTRSALAGWHVALAQSR